MHVQSNESSECFSLAKCWVSASLIWERFTDATGMREREREREWERWASIGKEWCGESCGVIEETILE